MKILVILGDTLGSGDLGMAYAGIVPKLLQQGLEKGRTPFADHEIIVAMIGEAINAYFEQLPDRMMFVGAHFEKGKTPESALVCKLLTREMDRRKFLFTNPITAPPFHKEENFFVITDADGMAKWLEL